MIKGDTLHDPEHKFIVKNPKISTLYIHLCFEFSNNKTYKQEPYVHSLAQTINPIFK